MGYTPLQAGVRLIPVAVVLMIAAPLSSVLVARFGTKIIVTFGLFIVAAALLLLSRATSSSGYGLVVVVLVVLGLGMGIGHGAGHRLDHGVAAAGQGRRRIGRQRHDP